MDDLGRQKLKESVSTLNYISPVIWNNQTGHVVDGNQRLRVLY
jgi:ParB-like chromosome segregation protein Spo0J